MNRFTTVLTTFSLALLNQLAWAGPTGDAPSMIVRFPDLDLTRTEGAATLYQRISGAAKMVCAPLESRDLGSVARFRGCVESAISSAVAKVDHPGLTAYAKTKSRVAPIQVAQR